uniref:Uncharacterized protein n=1 Tax=uncultured marine virus TaxID=186617 RepID=A0A0F7L5V7_9VIRU|nr:hypothetical protein AciX9_2155 [uncultured marine virus]
MGWPHVPQGWLDSFDAGTHSPPLVEVRVLEEGTGWNIVTDNCELMSCDLIETKIDYFAFGGLSKSKDIRMKFVDDDGAGGRGSWFDSSSNIQAGWPILVRITFGSDVDPDWPNYRTVYSGKIIRIENNDDASVSLVCREWFSWWAENTSIDLPWAFTAYPYVSPSPFVVDPDFSPKGSCFLNNSATDDEKFTGAATSYADNWPATFAIWSEEGIPAAWLNDGYVTRFGSNTVATVDSSLTYFSDWDHAATIYTRPKTFYGHASSPGWLRSSSTGLNWCGCAKVDPDPDNWPDLDQDDRIIYNIQPPFLGYNDATHAFSVRSYTESAPVVTTGGVAHIGPDIENWHENDTNEGDKGDFFWASWHNQGSGMGNFAIYRNSGEDVQDGLHPHDNFNTSRWNNYETERSVPIFGDARDRKRPLIIGSADNPPGYYCYSPAQSECIGHGSLLMPNSYLQGVAGMDRRSNYIDGIYAIMTNLGNYKRPPVPEIDGSTEYALQDGFTSTDLETNGYTQAASSGGTAPLWEAVTADYLEDGSRYPAIKDWGRRAAVMLSLNEEVLKPGAKFSEILDTIGKSFGLFIYQSPFGQIDFEVVRPLKDSSTNAFYDTGSVTVPVFRASTGGNDPNIAQTSSDRNAWKIKWKDMSAKAVKSVSVDYNYIAQPETGLTKVKKANVTKEEAGPGGSYTPSGEKDLKISTPVILGYGSAYLLASNAIESFGEPLDEVSFEAPLRFLSDDRDRGASGVMLRVGRPVEVVDNDHNKSAGETIITGLGLDVCAGTMRLTGVSGSTGASGVNCYSDAEYYDLGTVGAGLTDTATVTITNDSNSAISGTAVIAGGNAWSITNNATYTDLAAGATHDIEVTFAPLSPGEYITLMSLGNGCTVGGEIGRVSFRGHAVDLPICVMQPGGVDCGEFYVGHWIPKTLEITNYGSGTLDGDIWLAEEDNYAQFAIYDGDVELGPGPANSVTFALTHLQTLELEVRFRPSSIGEFKCRLLIDADVDCRGSLGINEVPITGQGVPIPDCFISPQSVLVDQVIQGATSGNAEVTQNNTSNNDYSGTAVVHQRTGGPFIIDSYSIVSPANGTTVTDNLDGTYDWDQPHGGAQITWNICADTTTSTPVGLFNGNIDFGDIVCAKVGLLAKVVSQGSDCVTADLSLQFGTIGASPSPAPTQTVVLTNNSEVDILEGVAEAKSVNGWFTITGGIPDGTSTVTDNLDGTFDWELDPGDFITWTVEFDPGASVGVDTGAIQWGEVSPDSPCASVGLQGQSVDTLWSVEDSVHFQEIKSDTVPITSIVVSNHHMTDGGDLVLTAITDTSVGVCGFMNQTSGARCFVGGASTGYYIAGFFDSPQTHTIQCFWDPGGAEGSCATGNPKFRVARNSPADEEIDVYYYGTSFNPTGCHIATSTSHSSVLNRFNVGDQFVSTNSATQTVEVFNLNSTPLVVTPTINSVGSNWVRTGGDMTPGSSYTITQNNSKTMEVQLQLGASDRGVQLGKVSFGQSCGDTATMFGYGVAVRDRIDVNPTTLMFTSVSGATDTRSVSIYNTSESLTIESTASLVVAGGGTNYYSIATGHEDISIGPGSSHTISVTVDPGSAINIPTTFLDLGGTGEDLDGMYVPMGTNVTTAFDGSNIVLDDTPFNSLLSSETDVQSALETLDGHTHSDYLEHDGSVAITGDLDFGGFDATNIAEISRTTGNITVDMKTDATERTLQVKNTGTTGSAHLTVQNDLTVGGTIGTGITASRVVVADASSDLIASSMTLAEAEELTDGSVTALHGHKYRYPIDFGQRNTGGSDYWDTYALVSGYAGYRATTTGSAGSVVELSFTCEISGYSSAGNFECEIYAGQLGASATMIKEEVTAITGTGYIQVSQTYAPGTYTFNANDMIALYGRLTGGVTAWRYGVARVIVEYDS